MEIQQTSCGTLYLTDQKSRLVLKFLLINTAYLIFLSYTQQNLTKKVISHKKISNKHLCISNCYTAILKRNFMNITMQEANDFLSCIQYYVEFLFKMAI